MIFSSFHEIIIFPMEFPGFSYLFPVALHSPPPDRTWLGEVAGGLHPRWPSDNDLALKQPG